MKSRYNNVVVSGCSFTTDEHVPGGGSWNWASTLCDKVGMTIHNLASGGAGNDHISRSIIVYLERHKLDPQDTLVMAMWSGVGRIDWVVDSKLVNNMYNYNYTPQTRLSAAGHWWNNPFNGKASLMQTTVQNYSKYQSNHTFALASWLAMQSLQSYLRDRKFNHYFTSFCNYDKNDIKGDALTVPFDQTLQEMGLACDYSSWLPLADTDYLGDWCRTQGLVSNHDNFHPWQDGPQRWAYEVLIPTLKNLNVLYESN